MTVANAYDKVLEYAWVVLVATVGWAWRVNDRLTRLETKHEATDQLVQDINGKLDRLIDKLL